MSLVSSSDHRTLLEVQCGLGVNREQLSTRRENRFAAQHPDTVRLQPQSDSTRLRPAKLLDETGQGSPLVNRPDRRAGDQKEPGQMPLIFRFQDLLVDGTGAEFPRQKIFQDGPAL